MVLIDILYNSYSKKIVKKKKKKKKGLDKAYILWYSRVLFTLGLIKRRKGKWWDRCCFFIISKNRDKRKTEDVKGKE
jgi:hypothetical protein